MMYSKAEWGRIVAMPMVYDTARFPVQVAGDAGSMAAWVFTPPRQALPAEPLVLLLVPGWPHDKRYWHFVPSASDGTYSCAQYLCEHLRSIVVVCDHIGTGESSRLDSGWPLTLDVLADAQRQVAAQIKDRLRTGTLVSNLPRLSKIHLAAIGHGMGALVLHRAQAESSPYEGVAFLGWSHSDPSSGTDTPETLSRALRTEVQGYVTLPPAARQALRASFYSDVPEGLIEIDEQQASALPAGMLASLFTPGSAKADAMSITTPVFLGYGEYESPDHEEDAACYQSAASVQVFTLSGSGHCHNLAQGREVLWKEIGWWLQGLAARREGDIRAEVHAEHAGGLR